MSSFGFLGAGNMGGAIFKGLLAKNVCSGENVYLYDLDRKKLDGYKAEFGINACDNYEQLIEKSDVLFLAIKPNMFPNVLPQIAEYIKKYKPLVISIAAGVSTEKIYDLLGFKTKLVRVMPNINAQINLSTSGYYINDLCDENDKNIVKTALEAIGYATEISENLFSVFAAIGGCSPAYVYMFINALAQGAVQYGMPKKQALEVAASAVMGSATMALKAGKHPSELADMVCSPGGTTIEGVVTLEENAFNSAVIKAVEASIIKDQKLGK